MVHLFGFYFFDIFCISGESRANDRRFYICYPHCLLAPEPRQRRSVPFGTLPTGCTGPPLQCSLHRRRQRSQLDSSHCFCIHRVHICKVFGVLYRYSIIASNRCLRTGGVDFKEGFPFQNVRAGGLLSISQPPIINQSTIMNLTIINLHKRPRPIPRIY